MRSLSASSRGQAGTALPEIMPTLTQAGVRPRRGQVTMICGQPGGGKTLLALWYVAHRDVTTLFFSADSDAHTVRTRVAAMLSGQTCDQIDVAADIDGPEAIDDIVAPAMGGKEFVWEPAPTLDDITLELLAYEEKWGEPPELIVIDNLMNVVGDGESWDGMRDTFKFLHHLARKSQAGVWVLHHTTEAGAGGRKPPNPAYPQPRSDIQGKLAQLPEMILTVAHDGYRSYRIACVKNRQGPSSPTAQGWTELTVDLPRMQLFDTQAEFNLAAQRRSWT